jgi:type II secretion system protein H
MKLIFSKQVNQGFTLIEMMVTIAIMGIMAAIATPSFFTWVNNKKVDDVLAIVQGALSEAQATAIRKNTSCNILITSNTVSAVKDDGSANPSCLLSGTKQIQPSSDPKYNIVITGTGGSSGTTIKYSARGTVNITPSTEAVVIYRTDSTTEDIKKCLVVSSGIGIMKTGKFTGSLPLTLSTPPTATEASSVAAQCQVAS